MKNFKKGVALTLAGVTICTSISPVFADSNFQVDYSNLKWGEEDTNNPNISNGNGVKDLNKLTWENSENNSSQSSGSAIQMTERTHYENALLLELEGVLKGNLQKDLMLDQGLKRRDSIVMLSRLLGQEDRATNYPAFESWVDVNPNSFYGSFASWAKDNNYFKGDSTNRFNPTEEISAKEYSIVLLRALGYDVEDDNTWGIAFNQAMSLGLLNNVNVSENDKITRAEMSTMTINALITKIWDQDITLAESLNIDVSSVINPEKPTPPVNPEEPEEEPEEKPEEEPQEDTEEDTEEKPQEDFDYATKILKVDSSNKKEVVITFDGKLKEEWLEKADLQVLSKGHDVVDIERKEIYKDKLIIQVADELKENTEYLLDINHLELNDFIIRGRLYRFKSEDKTPIDIDFVKGIGKNGVLVRLTEPVSDELSIKNFKIDDEIYGENITVIGRSVIIETYRDLEPGEHKIEITNLIDTAGIKTDHIEKFFKVVEDTESPVVVQAIPNGNSVEVKFDEPVKAGEKSLLFIKEDKDGKKTNIAPLSVDRTGVNKYRFIYKNGVLPKGPLKFMVDRVEDYSGNKIKPIEIETKHNIDIHKPEILSTILEENKKEFTVVFNKEVDENSVKDLNNYRLVNMIGEDIEIQKVSLSKDNTTATITLKEELGIGHYSIIIKDIKDLAEIPNILDPYSTSVTIDQIDGVINDKFINSIKWDVLTETITTGEGEDEKTEEKEITTVDLKFSIPIKEESLKDASNYLIEFNNKEKQSADLLRDDFEIEVIDKQTVKLKIAREDITGLKIYKFFDEEDNYLESRMRKKIIIPNKPIDPEKPEDPNKPEEKPEEPVIPGDKETEEERVERLLKLLQEELDKINDFELEEVNAANIEEHIRSIVADNIKAMTVKENPEEDNGLWKVVLEIEDQLLMKTIKVTQSNKNEKPETPEEKPGINLEDALMNKGYLYVYETNKDGFYNLVIPFDEFSKKAVNINKDTKVYVRTELFELYNLKYDENLNIFISEPIEYSEKSLKTLINGKVLINIKNEEKPEEKPTNPEKPGEKPGEGEVIEQPEEKINPFDNNNQVSIQVSREDRRIVIPLSKNLTNKQQIEMLKVFENEEVFSYKQWKKNPENDTNFVVNQDLDFIKLYAKNHRLEDNNLVAEISGVMFDTMIADDAAASGELTFYPEKASPEWIDKTGSKTYNIIIKEEDISEKAFIFENISQKFLHIREDNVLRIPFNNQLTDKQQNSLISAIKNNPVISAKQHPDLENSQTIENLVDSELNYLQNLRIDDGHIVGDISPDFADFLRGSDSSKYATLTFNPEALNLDWVLDTEATHFSLTLQGSQEETPAVPENKDPENDKNEDNNVQEERAKTLLSKNKSYEVIKYNDGDDVLSIPINKNLSNEQLTAINKLAFNEREKFFQMGIVEDIEDENNTNKLKFSVIEPYYLENTINNKGVDIELYNIKFSSMKDSLKKLEKKLNEYDTTNNPRLAIVMDTSMIDTDKYPELKEIKEFGRLDVAIFEKEK